MNVTYGANASIVDSRVNAYLKDMERRAFDRLLKYHYYMAKAYEYRLLEPYNATLDLQPLYNQITTIAGATANTTGGLSQAERDSLKTIFTSVIGSTTSYIINTYNSNPSVTENITKTYTLNADEIASLNRGETISLNFFNRGTFPQQRENVRIVSLKVRSMGTQLATVNDHFGQQNEVSLYMEHSGISNLEKDGEVYQFRHYNKETRNKITWHSDFDPLNQQLAPTHEPEALSADVSLIGSLVPGLTAQNAILFSRPSAWADLTIWRGGNLGDVQFFPGNNRNTNPPVLITNVTLELTYDYRPRPTSPEPPRNMEILAAQEDGAAVFPVDDTMAPYFIVSRPDQNDRQDGRGRFLRIYPYNAPAVQVTAQDAYGSLGFYKWIENGQDLGANRTISISTTIDHRIIAQYVSLLPVRIRVSHQPADPGRSSALLPSRAARAIATGFPWVHRVARLANGHFLILTTGAPQATRPP